MRGLRVFEWGAGGSTLWFADRASRVVSIEHDEQWHARVWEHVAVNPKVDLYLIPLGPAYWLSIHTHPSDFILIDGRHRKACAEQVKLCSNPPAAILWDDVQRDYYQCGMHFDGYGHRDFLDTEHPRVSRLFVRTDGPLAHWLAD